MSLKLYFVLFSTLIVSCTKSGQPPSAPLDLVQQGRKVYAANCTACHNVNPRIDGAVGPSVYGSNLELLEQRILHSAYPPGYSAKRPTHIMPALPYLKADIPALHAYLNAP